MNSIAIKELVVYSLIGMEMSPSYKSEEGDFQTAVLTWLQDVLQHLGPENVVIKGSVGGSDRPRIDMLGTNLWPDIEISIAGERRLAIELKLIRPNVNLSGGIKEAIGQAFIYRLCYPHSIAFVASANPGHEGYHEYDEQLHDWCERNGMTFILRALPPISI